ncbi:MULTISPECIES: hypothetical protein [unclassified Bradyrhizobium]|uniref:hypothetical protein n=1 Tax=unclassified Bradyrhizobium TaxID=2631580 RepID=UPI003391C70F
MSSAIVGDNEFWDSFWKSVGIRSVRGHQIIGLDAFPCYPDPNEHRAMLLFANNHVSEHSTQVGIWLTQCLDVFCQGSKVHHDTTLANAETVVVLQMPDNLLQGPHYQELVRSERIVSGNRYLSG